MDIGMPQLNGLEATRQIVKHVPSVSVLILSCYSDDEYVQGSAEAGAAGYLLKQTAVEELLSAIREASRGNSFFSPAISKRLMENYRLSLKGPAAARPGAYLTARETQMLRFIAEGRANKQIAAEQGLSIKTVEKHRQNLMNKLKIHDIAGLTRYAISKGLVQVHEMPKAA
jgi:DNA-binding NarL/FixJ family response regulator